jgi:hypothetical protein
MSGYLFSFGGQFKTSDYCTAAKIGNDNHERTVKYYTKDGSFMVEPITDMCLLAITLLEKFGSISKVSERDQMTKNKIREDKKQNHDAIDAIESDAGQNFLSSLKYRTRATSNVLPEVIH